MVRSISNCLDLRVNLKTYEEKKKSLNLKTGNANSMENKNEPKDNDHKFIYFVDSDKYENDNANTTGALIKAKLPEAKSGYALYLEGHGNDPDTLINDDRSVSLEKGAKHFYTVPPASFGIA